MPRAWIATAGFQAGPQTHICGNDGFCNRQEVVMSRLTIDITIQQHQSLKALAALQGKTIKQYALERLFPADASGDQAWRELQTLLGNASSKAWPDKPRPSASVPSLKRNWARAKPLEPRLCSDCGGRG
jgi:hypothetical protein